MRFVDYIGLAFRNLGRQKLRSFLTVLAIIIGATSVTIMLALVTSIKSFFLQEFNSTGQVRQIAVTQATDLTYGQARYGGGGSSQSGVKLTDDMLGQIKKIPHVQDASPQIGLYMFDSVNYQNKKLSVQSFQAYEPNGVLNYNVVAGRNLTEEDRAGAVTLTAEYADKLGFKGRYQQLIGQKITLKTVPGYTGAGANLPPNPLTLHGAQPVPQTTDFSTTVIGVVGSQTGQAAMYFPLDWARGLLETQDWKVENGKARLVTTDNLGKNGYQSITVAADEAENANAVAKVIRDKFSVGASTAQDFIQKQLAIFNIIGYVLGGIGGISLAVAAVGVVNTMVMATMERTREIGVMRAVGAKRATISRLFTLEASLLGFLGGMLGIGIGFMLVTAANPLVNKQLAANGIASKNIITLPAWLLLGVVVITTLIGMLAGLYPARRAAKLNPVDALRHE